MWIVFIKCWIENNLTYRYLLDLKTIVFATKIWWIFGKMTINYGFLHFQLRPVNRHVTNYVISICILSSKSLIQICQVFSRFREIIVSFQMTWERSIICKMKLALKSIISSPNILQIYSWNICNNKYELLEVHYIFHLLFKIFIIKNH